MTAVPHVELNAGDMAAIDGLDRGEQGRLGPNPEVITDVEA